MKTTLIFLTAVFLICGSTTAAADPSDWTVATPRSRGISVSIVNGRWQINGSVTYPKSKAEGLLLNVRMVNAVFEDAKRPEFDPEANTTEFLAKIDEYTAHGVRAFTLNLQGGMPGYEGALNSAFSADGALRHEYMKRVSRVIRACDRLGAVVILGCFYQRQDQILRDESAVRAAVLNVVRWIETNDCRNVLLEIANEFGHPGFDHPILKTAAGQIELVRLAKKAAPALLVSTSGLGNGRLPEEVARASDFLLIHFNETPLTEIPNRIAALKRYGKPIVCNEDAKLGKAGRRAVELSVENGASWGLMAEHINQRYPFTFRGPADDPDVYEKFKELAGPKRR